MVHSGRMPLVIYCLKFVTAFVFFLIECLLVGESPAPFTQITNKEICDGVWMPREEKHLEWAKHYTSSLEAKGRYTLIIWPEHCIVRTISLKKL